MGQLLHTSCNCAMKQQQAHNTMPGASLPKCPWEREREGGRKKSLLTYEQVVIWLVGSFFCQISPNDKNQIFKILISKRPTHNIAFVHSEKLVKRPSSLSLSFSASLKAGTELNLHCKCKLFKTFSLQIS